MASGAAPAEASSPLFSRATRRVAAAQGDALRLKQLEDLPELPQAPAARFRAARAGAGFPTSPQAPAGELVGLGIAARDGESLMQMPSHHRTTSQDETDPDSSASSLALLVDSFPPPPSFTPWPNSPLLSSPAHERRFLPSLTSPETERGRSTYLSPALCIAEPVSPDYSPAAPPKIPLPPLPTLHPSAPGAWTPPASPLPPPRPPAFDPLSPPRAPLPPLPRPTRPPSSGSFRRRSSLPLDSIGRLPTPPPPSDIDFDELLAHPLPKKRLSRRSSTTLAQSASSENRLTSQSENSAGRSASLSPTMGRKASVVVENVDEAEVLEATDAPTPLQAVTIDLGSETSEESELDLDISLNAAGWRAGVMGKGVGFDSESEEEKGRVSPVSAPRSREPSNGSLRPPSNTRRRSYQSYKLVRRPSREPEDDSSGSSAEEELFDLAFDSTTSSSTTSFSPFSRHSRRSTASSSAATPRQSWVEGVESSSPPMGWRTNIWGREAPVESPTMSDPPSKALGPFPPAPSPSPSPSPSSEPRRLLKSKSAGQLRRPSRSFLLRPEEPSPPPVDLASSFSDRLASSASSQGAPKSDIPVSPTTSTSQLPPARRSSLPSSVAFRQLSLPLSTSSLATRSDRSPRRPPLPPLPPSLTQRSPSIKQLALVQQFDRLPPPSVKGVPTRLPQRGHARKTSSTLRYV